MRILTGLALLLLFASCTNNTEIAKAKDVNPETIFYDYKLWAEEGREEATLTLQYRFGGENGTTLVLEEPSKVSFDGTPLPVDSATLAGAYYEVIKPVSAFTGRHTIVFTDKNKKEHKEEFSFAPFTLAAEFPETLKKEPFVVKLNGLPAKPTNLRLVITDTAFASKDVNEELRVENGEIRIDNKLLRNLANGPVTLEIFREEERPLKNASKEGGRLLLNYGLKRGFEFVD